MLKDKLNQKENKITSVQKALAIIDCFSLKRVELGITEIAKIMNFGKSTFYPIVKNLRS